MQSTLLIQDLSLDQELGSQAMAAVHGGYGAGLGIKSQANTTYQANNQELFAPVSVGNGSAFMGKGAVNFNVVSNPTQTSSNSSTSSNSMGWEGLHFLRAAY